MLASKDSYPDCKTRHQLPPRPYLILAVSRNRPPIAILSLLHTVPLKFLSGDIRARTWGLVAAKAVSGILPPQQVCLFCLSFVLLINFNQKCSPACLISAFACHSIVSISFHTYSSLTVCINRLLFISSVYLTFVRRTLLPSLIYTTTSYPQARSKSAATYL